MLKAVIIHGQNHKGSTYHIAHMLAEKIEGEITEFFLPRDFGEFCVGCNTCLTGMVSVLKRRMRSIKRLLHSQKK